MQFYIEGYSEAHGIPEQKMDIYPHIKLVTDDFDDYGNQSLFRMYYKKNNRVSYIYFGKVKIIHATEPVARDVMPNKFESLGQEYCSLGQSIEYYKQIRWMDETLDLGQEIVRALNDIAIYHDIFKKFPDKYGVKTSLMRASEAFHAYSLGHNLFYGISSHIKEKVEFTFAYDKERDKKVQFQFNDSSGLPNRINVVVGKNGTGKTMMLSRLASVLSGRSNSELNGEVDRRPEFSRYIAVSYSAFDNFEKTFVERCSKKEIVLEKEYILDLFKLQKHKCEEKLKKDDSFRQLYLYFHDVDQYINELENREGFKNYFKELKQGVEDEADALKNRIGSYVYCGLVREGRIISEKEMFATFERNIREVIQMNRGEEWFSVMENIFDGVSDLKSLFIRNEKNEVFINEEKFKYLSSGQKIMLHIFTQVFVSITEDSLLLIDEPEIHLHPNAISSFMRMLNMILDSFNSFAVISTHSPIVLQEIPSRYIRVFNMNEGADDKLWEECFGNNISSIVSDVFEVRPNESNYKSFFAKQKEDGKSKEEIEALFEDRLSLNAEMYLNLLYRKETDEKITRTY